MKTRVFTLLFDACMFCTFVYFADRPLMSALKFHGACDYCNGCISLHEVVIMLMNTV